MLHGLGADLTFMQGEIDRLSAHFRVLALDSRGHGRSDRPAQYTLTDHIQDVLGVLDALKLDRVNLLGSSMGSYIAQGVAIAAPERVRKLVLIVPKASGKTSSTARFLAEHADEIKDMTPEQVQAFVAAHIFAPTTPEHVRQRLVEVSQAQMAAGLAQTPEQNWAANQALEGFDFRADLPHVTAPTLVISGRYDPLNTVADGQELATLIPGARFEVLERSGHVATLEQPAELLALVEDFLMAGESII